MFIGTMMRPWYYLANLMTLKTNHDTKRIALLLFVLVLSLIACNGRSPSPGTTNLNSEPSPIQVLVASDDITSEQPRIPLILQEGTEPVTDKEWGLTSEPWTFILDRQGVVAARFGGPLSPQELTATLDNLLP